PPTGAAGAGHATGGRDGGPAPGAGRGPGDRDAVEGDAVPLPPGGDGPGGDVPGRATRGWSARLGAASPDGGRGASVRSPAVGCRGNPAWRPDMHLSVVAIASLLVWSVAPPTPPFWKQKQWVSSVAFTPNGKQIITAGWHGEARHVAFWSLDTMTLVRRIEGL